MAKYDIVRIKSHILSVNCSVPGGIDANQTKMLLTESFHLRKTQTPIPAEIKMAAMTTPMVILVLLPPLSFLAVGIVEGLVPAVDCEVSGVPAVGALLSVALERVLVEGVSSFEAGGATGDGGSTGS